MSILWTERSAAQATGGKTQGKWNATGVAIDSRTIKPGELFVAIKGENFDGHDYVEAAFKNGAVAAVVKDSGFGIQDSGGNYVSVPDTLKALEDLGRYARSRSAAHIIGVTGSVGKTSTKEMLRLALAVHGNTYASVGNLNNHIGTPLNLANLPPEAQFAVFEMGMNHAGEIAHLTKMVQPHVAAITNVEAVHMEFFGTIEKIAQAKAEIFEGVEAGGTAIINRDSPMYPLLVTRAKERGLKVASFGAHVKSDCRLVDYGAGISGCSVEANIHGATLNYTLGAVGRHWALTSLLVLAVAHALGLDAAKTSRSLSRFTELAGRGRVTTLAVGDGELFLIDDSYNASPAAMRAAFLKTAELWEASGRAGRKIAALGNMLELGDESPSLHAGLAADLKGFDGVFTAGELMKHLHDALPPKLRAGHVAKAMELLPLLQKELRAGDIVLVKGSHGSKIYELAKALMENKNAV